MRTAVTLCALVAVACAGAARTRLPPALARLTLVEGHPQISPVEFDHAQHVDARAMGRDVACVECHHTLRERPDEVPAPCTDCHEYGFMRPPVDESLPHDHSAPPDL